MTPPKTAASWFRIGAPVTPYTVRPTTVQLFRFSAATWNAHRIHYDSAYARSEGHPDVLVQSHLHGCFLVNALLKWAGPQATLRSLRWRNRRIAVADDVLTVTGHVMSVVREGDDRLVEVELAERDQRGAVCVSGQAVVCIPAESS
ncbi:FAS1-like dehydratase domain-containing protein [Amycolatopsis jejuensis]|uniref:FAS1-like dehydratase domain-containing protein n=1 Tax=Amycolatopsis jejuensis TaxID=330084 RepID=UPI000526DABD|nr:MaoC family dehydratase N-terminal domain-containing protein [Amycolatopsis jejuensis]